MKFLTSYELTKNTVFEPQFESDLTHWENFFFISSARALTSTKPLLLKNHNEHVFNYYQAVLRATRRPYYFSENYKFIANLITLNTKRGYKHKAFKTLCAVLAYIYSYFDEYRSDVRAEYSSYTTFFEFSRDFPDEFYKPDFFIKYVHLYLELIFLIKKVKPKKKLKKKKIQQKLLVSYIPAHIRSRLTTRLLNTYLNSATAFNKTTRLAGALLYLVLSGKESYLYKKKLTMYNKLLEKKKFY